jgi:hypothetical protein
MILIHGIATRARVGRAVSSIEVVTAMAVFGVTLLGLLATGITHIKLASSLEQRATVLMPPGCSLQIDSFDASSGQFRFDYAVDPDLGTVVSSAGRWAIRLGVASLSTHDVRSDPSGRAARFPFLVASPFLLSFDTIPASYQPAFAVSPDGALNVDVETISVVAVQVPL